MRLFIKNQAVNLNPGELERAEVSFSFLHGRKFKADGKTFSLNGVIDAVLKEALKPGQDKRELREWSGVFTKLTEKGYGKSESKSNFFVMLLAKIKHYFAKKERDQLLTSLIGGLGKSDEPKKDNESPSYDQTGIIKNPAPVDQPARPALVKADPSGFTQNIVSASVSLPPDISEPTPSLSQLPSPLISSPEPTLPSSSSITSSAQSMQPTLPALSKPMSNKELNDLLKKEEALTDQNIDHIDFKSIENMDYYKFKLIFGSNLNFNKTSPEDKEHIKRIKSLNKENLNFLLEYFKRGHALALDPEQISQINFKEAIAGKTPQFIKELFEIFFSLPGSDIIKKFIKALRGENLDVFVEFFKHNHASALDPEQISDIDFAKAIEKGTPEKSEEVFTSFFGHAAMFQDDIDRFKKLKVKQLFAPFFTVSHFKLLSDNEISSIDFTKVIDANKEIGREKFKALFGSLSVMDESQMKLLDAIKDGKSLIHLALYFGDAHWNALNKTQVEILVQNKNQLDPTTLKKLLDRTEVRY